MRLVKRPGSPNWYVRYYDGKRTRIRSTGETNRRNAEIFASTFLLEASKPAEVGLVEILASYYEDHAKALPSGEQADIAINHLGKFFGNPRAEEITPMVDAYVKHRKKAASESTISRELSVLRAALNHAHKKGWIGTVGYIRSLPQSRPRERYLTRQEAARLLRACLGLHIALFVRIGLYTGARPGAIFDLTWDRVDLKNRLIRFAGEGAVSNKRRATVPIHGALYTALERAQKRAETDWVVEYGGRRIYSVKTGFRNACRRAGLKGVTPYTLRHTAATWAAQAGVGLFEIAGMLGHTNIAMTQRYAKHHPDYLRSAARAMLRGK